jgi:hypothetical protein
MNIPEISPKEKAQQLLRRFFVVSDGALDDTESPTLDPENYAIARNCALACIDFIYEFMKEDDDLHECASNANSVWVDYYQRVIKEL